MATTIEKMKRIESFSELKNLIDSDSQLIWFSKSFQCGFKIKKILNYYIPFNHMECVFESGQIAHIKLTDIYSI